MTGFNRIVLDEAAKTVTVQPARRGTTSRMCSTPASRSRRCSRPTSSPSAARSRSTPTAWTTRPARWRRRSLAARDAAGRLDATVSADREPELFGLVVGGYGLFGVILDAELESPTTRLPDRPPRHRLQDFPALFSGEIAPDPNSALMYGHLSTAPGSVPARDDALHLHAGRRHGPQRRRSASRADQAAAARSSTCPSAAGCGERSGARRRHRAADRGVHGHAHAGDRRARRAWSRATSRCTTRCRTCATPADETDILHEYFIPRSRSCLRRRPAQGLTGTTNVLNASVRVVHREDNFLTYAPEPAFSVVLYINQRPTTTATARWRS